MKLFIEYLGPFRSITGKRTETLKINASNLQDVLNFLIAKYGFKFEREVFNSDKTVKPYILIVLNGTMTRELGITVKENDRIAIVYPAEGG